jgi:hypothetical protein
LCAGRIPLLLQSSKIAPRAFGAVNSPDATCARHALAVAALAARDMPGMYVEQLGQLVANTLEIYHKTGGWASELVFLQLVVLVCCMPGMYVEQLGQLVANMLEIYHKTGRVAGGLVWLTW